MCLQSSTQPFSTQFLIVAQSPPQRHTTVSDSMQSACWRCGAAPSDGTEDPTTSALVLEPTGRLLCSNDAPLSTEITAIQRSLSAQHARIKQLESEIQELRRVTEQRIRELQETEERAESYAAALSPIRRVPAETPSEIFALSLPYTRRIGEHSLEQAPWRLGHVCHRWREAAVGFPFLWSSITLYADRRFSIDDRCPPLCQDPAPSLGECSTPSYGDWSSHPIRQPMSSASPPDCVKRSLPPDTGRVYMAIKEFELPWPQITHFRGSYSGADHALRDLGSASKIVECRMSVFSDAEPLNGQHIVLNDLRRLTLITPGFLFDFITTPGLQELWTSGVSHSLRDSIQRSSCQLVKLVLEKLVFDEFYDIDILLSILQATPTLTTLYVAEITDSRVFFNALKLANGPSSDLCPHLSHIAAGEVPLNALDSFLDMVESRWYTASRRLSFARAFYESSRGQDPVPRMI
ncbi:hypothetical protein B0H14DRAFT_3143277 [Mycena olivaceomarginata]|nr:hypothetical protein B0H14DRAFT_3143277 [Mycena olivaceomarginata]